MRSSLVDPPTRYLPKNSPIPGTHYCRAASRCGTKRPKPRKGPGNCKLSWRHCTARSYLGVRYLRIEMRSLWVSVQVPEDLRLVTDLRGGYRDFCFAQGKQTNGGRHTDSEKMRNSRPVWQGQKSDEKRSAGGQVRRRGVLQQETTAQKLSFSPSCIMRGSRVDVTLLNKLEVKLSEAQQIGLVWLKVLNVSQRS